MFMHLVLLWAKGLFVQWLSNIPMLDYVDWLLVGDFNLYHNPKDRNRLGADYAEMLLFNEAIRACLDSSLPGNTWPGKQSQL